MRDFLSLIRDPEKSRLDIFCYNEKEVPDLDEILRKKFGFCIFRTDKDSILAFKIGEYSQVKEWTKFVKAVNTANANFELT